MPVGVRVDTEQFVRLYGLGMSPQQIADAMGIAYMSVKGVRRRLGLPAFRRNGSRINHDRFRALHAQGLTTKEVARELQVNTSSVLKLRKRLGLSRSRFRSAHQRSVYRKDRR